MPTVPSQRSRSPAAQWTFLSHGHRHNSRHTCFQPPSDDPCEWYFRCPLVAVVSSGAVISRHGHQPSICQKRLWSCFGRRFHDDDRMFGKTKRVVRVSCCKQRSRSRIFTPLTNVSCLLKYLSTCLVKHSFGQEERTYGTF